MGVLAIFTPHRVSSSLSQNASSDLEVGFQPRVLKNPDEYAPNRFDVEYVHSPLVCAQDKKATVLGINPGIYLETGSPPRWGNLWASWSRGSDSLPLYHRA